jgi:hypothetical protein
MNMANFPEAEALAIEGKPEFSHQIYYSIGNSWMMSKLDCRDFILLGHPNRQ